MLSFGTRSHAMRYHNFWFVIIRFKRFLQTRSENSEKLGKVFFYYDLSSEALKNTFTGLKTPQNCPFSSHLFFRQSWTKVLRHFCISEAFSNSHRPNPSPHPTNNIGRVYLGVTVHQFMLISICKCLCNIMGVSWFRSGVWYLY